MNTFSAEDPTSATPAPTPRALRAVGVLVFTALGMLAGTYEVMLVPFRISASLVPIAPVLAVISNGVLPRLSRRMTGDNIGAAAPVVGWVIAVVVLAIGRPEGDVFLSSGSGGDAVVGYVLMIVGFAVAVVTVLRTASLASLEGRAGRRAASAAFHGPTGPDQSGAARRKW